MKNKKLKIWKGKAIYKDKVFKPFEDINLPEGEEVTIIVVPPFATFLGILKEVKETGVELQHKIRDIWKSYGSH